MGEIRKISPILNNQAKTRGQKSKQVKSTSRSAHTAVEERSGYNIDGSCQHWNYVLLNTSSSCGRLLIYFTSVISTFVSHMFYFILFLLCIYTHTQTVYFNPLWSGRPSPFRKVEFSTFAFFRGAWWWPQQAETCSANLQIKGYNRVGCDRVLWRLKY
jgi:hypothetical protein